MMANDQITATVGQFLEMSGLGLTKTYELIGSGELESIKIGKRRLIVLDSYRRLIERAMMRKQEKISEE